MRDCGHRLCELIGGSCSITAGRSRVVRREARDDRNLVLQVRSEEPDLAPALARLLRRTP